MEGLHPDSAAAMTAHRREAVRLAQDQQRAVVEKCTRSKQSEPDYRFDELIGKGSFGRVYKGRQVSTNKVVAIKVLDIDDADFHAYGEQKDEQIQDFNREIRILRQAQDSGAENLNPMIEAMAVHSQLWLICEHCPGGSVKTLMRATSDRLSEKYIVVVARELAKALKGLHEAGIMHRDVKAANVLIHQEGRLQLCDFGVATVLDTRADKRKTFIGTLHWMPPELWTENPEYSDEVDVWEYGCTLYECAVGRPPNSDLRERQQLKMRMRRLKQPLTLPEKDSFSDGLRALVSYALSPDVATRPSMKDILEHNFLRETDDTHPTNSLSELVQIYYAWLFGGGQRVSLFMPGGAAAAATEDPDNNIDDVDEWNFGITQDFERRVSAILEIPDFSVISPSDTMEGEATPKGTINPSGHSPQMTQAQLANFEARVKRGADLSNLFDQSKPAYEYKTKTDFIPIPEQRRISDLPFRAMAEDRPSSIASNVIDLGDFDEADYAAVAAPRTDEKIQTSYPATPRRGETIRLADASTLRDKRANSKGPRDPQNQSLTARRTSSAEAVPRNTVSHDFAMSQEDWTVKNRTKAPELQEPAEITSSRPGHATMDWSFASAMSEASVTTVPQINAPEPSPVQLDEPSGEPSGATETTQFEQKARKHATMEWSFSNAMAEVSVTDDDQDEKPSAPSSTTVIDSSPPMTRQRPLQASRPTPTRPSPLTRQMTMPVTMDDFAHIEEQDIPRPSTALSEAYSDISTSSTDVDPFGLEREDDDYPGPATLEEDVGAGMSAFYSGRGRTMLGETTGMAYSSLSTANPLTGSGPSPYPMGRPARIGEEGFPGQSINTSMVNRPGRGAGGASSHARTSSTILASPSSSGQALPTTGTTVHRPVVEVPSAAPPSMAVLSDGASTDVIEAELTRMLEEMQGTLNAARGVVGGLERGWRRERESDEWEDEEHE
ncbi:STE/STE20 protein kinase [Exophiala aquamarina CBS 119918]|uniref:non-specific serine/threonine protein kinase n=1 Tax=Exophiala aquamarina CBS 119918 TaxID=1182545 RepID=A0A072PH63_9EURO|nr:STE/STE20 protein kinase [Exophiala aquamarina CBS 119918]KEF54855.1 STE/STE20 protein kinase [Exophiala aquamarina CBS 119918]